MPALSTYPAISASPKYDYISTYQEQDDGDDDDYFREDVLGGVDLVLASCFLVDIVEVVEVGGGVSGSDVHASEAGLGVSDEEAVEDENQDLPDDDGDQRYLVAELHFEFIY